MMTTQEQHEALNRIVAKNKHFEALSHDENFIKWKEESVTPYLESMKTSILGVDRSVPGWRDAVCEAIVAYQEAYKVYEGLFNASVKTVEQARQGLKKLAEVSD